MSDARDDLEPTPITISDEVLHDLRSRIRATSWPTDDGNDDGHYGVRRPLLQELAEYWADGYDWRAAECAMNTYEQYRVDISGVPVHFMRKAGVGPAPIPLILSHGWPWTFWHWSKVIDRLADPGAFGGNPADAFDVIVPSLPGFGYSTPTAPDMNFWKIADVWHNLMTGVLGHPKYAAAGCDVGALVTGQLGHKYADELYGIHIGSALKLNFFNGDRAWDLSGGRPIPEDMPAPLRDRLVTIERRNAVHLAAHVLAPSTLTYGLSDSPVGMLAWLLERWDKWSDDNDDIFTVFDRDDILTHATIYWTGRSIGSSVRTYANNNRYPWTPSHDRSPVIEAPTGITFVNYENPPGVTTSEERINSFLNSDRAAWYNHRNITSHPKGGHFTPWEIPEDWANDLVRTFQPLRTPQL
ncbi:epoxide hydrolase family protein [Tessaracoccus antarcticus]|uniref:Epoxide hydrolase n=1 Tax=Tessaracoccus antarcticus TaxID=2479848 RepID=A0A3M0GA04_9ACTN|nr:epoxide hydrolase family protein [Tessaracoccus antarcticus]RMB57829.1 epoxide hydrolase [Tessaracoccus antarcticus]